MKIFPITIEKIHKLVNQRPLLFVAVLSGLAGLCLGLSNATWQVSVETGQVLAGIVKYPPDNPFYIYHLKVFSIINHISALLLFFLKSEIVVSFIISALLGIISFQAIGLFIYAINRNIFLSIVAVLFIYFADYAGNKVVYPIWLLGFPHTFGILGLSFVVLTIALLGNQCYRISLFFFGLAPCVHPSWGVWLYFITFIAILWDWNFAWQVLRKHYPYFIAGFAISVSLFTYQSYLIHNIPQIESSMNTRLLNSFIKYWDSHRIQFYWDPKAVKRHFCWGAFFGIYSVIAAFIGMKQFKSEKSLSFLFKIIMSAGIASLLLGLVTQLPPDKVPMYLLMFMPGRYINLNNITLVACILGLLTCYENKKYIMSYNLFVFFLLCSFFSRHPEVKEVCFGVILSWLACLTFRRLPGVNRLFLQRSHQVDYGVLALVFMAIFLSINIPREKYLHRFIVHKDGLMDRTNDEFYATVSKREGMILGTHYHPMISLRTRRPILADMASPNFFSYAPEAALIFDNILKKIYGIDLRIPPPQDCQHREIPPELYKDLWEKRTIEQWQKIRDEFGVTDILTSADWTLSLPVVAKSPDVILYQIPTTHQ